MTLTFDRVDSGGTETPTRMERIIGVVTGGNFVSRVTTGRGADGSTEQAHTSPVVEYIPNAKDMDDAVDGILVEHLQTGKHGNITASTVNIGTTVALLGTLDEDTMSANSASHVVTQQSIKAYSDSGTQTLTNKTLTTPALNTPVITTPTIRTYDGWQDANATWEYASATTITVPSGAATIYQKGDKFKLTANSVVLQGYIITVADELLTVVGDALTNHTFTANYYSHASNPIGFPGWFAYTPVWDQGTTSPTLNNGTISGYFSISGKTVIFNIALVLGSTTSMGTGEFSLSVPLMGANFVQGGISGLIRDSGTLWYRITSYLGAEGTALTRIVGTENAVSTRETIPMTWANEDSLHLGGSYLIT